jgi:O-antigen/teichoic acid export membrane protein
MGALLSNLNANLSGLRRDIQLLPGEIARAMTAARLPEASAAGTAGRLRRLVGLLAELSPYVMLVVVICLKLWMPEAMPLIRQLLAEN